MYLYPFHWNEDNVIGYDEHGTIKAATITSKNHVLRYQWLFINGDEVVNDCPNYAVVSPEVWMYCVDSNIKGEVSVIVMSRDATQIAQSKALLSDLRVTAEYYKVTRCIRYSEETPFDDLGAIEIIDILAFTRRHSRDLPKFKIESASDLVKFCADNEVIETILTNSDICGLTIRNYLTLSDKEIAEALTGEKIVIEVEFEDDEISVDNKMRIIKALSLTSKELALMCFSLPVAICALILSSSYVPYSSRKKFSVRKGQIKRVKENLNEWTKSHSS